MLKDIYAYAHTVRTDEGTKVMLTLRSLDGTADTGCRFKYINPEIEFNYQSLVDALNEAIDKEAKITNNQFVTNERNVTSEEVDLDFDKLMEEFNTILHSIPKEKMPDYAPRITQIIEKTLGKGKKIGNAQRGQEEQIQVIIADLKDMLNAQ